MGSMLPSGTDQSLEQLIIDRASLFASAVSAEDELVYVGTPGEGA
jgi:hypothetical protein